jgi:hypothetical protein
LGSEIDFLPKKQNTIVNYQQMWHKIGELDARMCQHLHLQQCMICHYSLIQNHFSDFLKAVVPKVAWVMITPFYEAHRAWFCRDCV